VGTVDTVGHSSSPCGYGNTSVTKNRIETLREEFGDSWLQSFSSYQAGTPETTRKHTGMSSKITIFMLLAIQF